MNLGHGRVVSYNVARGRRTALVSLYHFNDPTMTGIVARSLEGDPNRTTILASHKLLSVVPTSARAGRPDTEFRDELIAVLLR